MEKGISVRRDDRLRADGVAHQVVAIQRDVERAGRHRRAPRDVAAMIAREAPGERHAARADADEREVVDAAVALENLVRDARQRASDAVGIHHDRHGRLPGQWAAGRRPDRSGGNGRWEGAERGVGMDTSSQPLGPR